MSAGNLYRYFPSKEAIVEELRNDQSAKRDVVVGDERRGYRACGIAVRGVIAPRLGVSSVLHTRSLPDTPSMLQTDPTDRNGEAAAGKGQTMGAVQGAEIDWRERRAGSQVDDRQGVQAASRAAVV